MFKLSLKDMNIPMGIQKLNTASSGKIKLEQGDVILAFTDGIIEQRNNDCKEFGFKRLSKLIQEIIHHDSNKIVETIFENVMNYKGTYPQQDDMTVVCFKYE